MRTLRALFFCALAQLSGACFDFRPLDAKSLCPLPSSRMCEGFEGPVVSPRWGQNLVGQATLDIDEDFALRGTGSLRVRAPRQSQGTIQRAQLYDVGDSSGPVRWIRAFVWSPDPSALNGGALVGAQQQASPYFAQMISVRDSRWTLGVKDATGSRAFSGPQEWPAERWVCLELALGIDSVPRLFVDGEEVMLSAEPVPATTPALVQAMAGVTFDPLSAMGPDAQVWIDELATSDTRIGCRS